MKVAVFFQPIAGNGYRASAFGGEVRAEGTTQDQALENLRQLLIQQLACGARTIELEFSATEVKPDWFDRIAGSLKDEPEFGEVLKLGAEIRKGDKSREEAAPE